MGGRVGSGSINEQNGHFILPSFMKGGVGSESKLKKVFLYFTFCSVNEQKGFYISPSVVTGEWREGRGVVGGGGQ